ncbi:hypothetical protein BCR37DRAFT_385984 [Protomyces lactucae-debilis]|uniref:Uncharacterized protein n=1 Tax=Protomyces lactucae-debilis TaxID=2754530 RepID=A0A1Y2FNN8_PROLT|nr:uncharacterized protein BCR37DRAFT_385984 [Protomyces lactucae-debilis]ORY85573.1 hypothetical protein BCR37DRAFT_385984 [Protomyces lactucae-debilis]
MSRSIATARSSFATKLIDRLSLHLAALGVDFGLRSYCVSPVSTVQKLESTLSNRRCQISYAGGGVTGVRQTQTLWEDELDEYPASGLLETSVEAAADVTQLALLPEAKVRHGLDFGEFSRRSQSICDGDPECQPAVQPATSRPPASLQTLPDYGPPETQCSRFYLEMCKWSTILNIMLLDSGTRVMSESCGVVDSLWVTESHKVPPKIDECKIEVKCLVRETFCVSGLCDSVVVKPSVARHSRYWQLLVPVPFDRQPETDRRIQYQ